MNSAPVRLVRGEVRRRSVSVESVPASVDVSRNNVGHGNRKGKTESRKHERAKPRNGHERSPRREQGILAAPRSRRGLRHAAVRPWGFAVYYLMGGILSNLRGGTGTSSVRPSLVEGP